MPEKNKKKCTKNTGGKDKYDITLKLDCTFEQAMQVIAQKANKQTV